MTSASVEKGGLGVYRARTMESTPAMEIEVFSSACAPGLVSPPFASVFVGRRLAKVLLPPADCVKGERNS